MSVWHINGKNRLRGSTAVQGAKNAVLPILAASILAPCETELTNVPGLRDVETSLRILRHLGCAAVRDGDTVNVDASVLTETAVPHALMREMRSSVLFLGALLARCGEARLSLPGGCELGKRPIDLHLSALRALGAEIAEDGGELICRAEKLRGAQIEFPTPSVGATENAILAACGAEGETVIRNAAREPEITDLQEYLRGMGAEIAGAGTSAVTVSGFSPRPRVGHRVMPDRIAAATLLCAAAACGGDVELRGVEPRYFDPVCRSLSQCGCDMITTSRSVRLRAAGRLRAPEPVITAPYPGFPTDAQPLLLAACLQAEGTAVFVENVFESRYRYVQELLRLGARVRTEGRVAVVTGVPELRGAPVECSDLRGGAALILAGLSAEGETAVSDAGHVIRGYERFDEGLRALGADIEFTEE